MYDDDDLGVRIGDVVVMERRFDRG